MAVAGVWSNQPGMRPHCVPVVSSLQWSAPVTTLQDPRIPNMELAHRNGKAVARNHSSLTHLLYSIGRPLSRRHFSFVKPLCISPRTACRQSSRDQETRNCRVDSLKEIDKLTLGFDEKVGIYQPILWLKWPLSFFISLFDQCITTTR